MPEREAQEEQGTRRRWILPMLAVLFLGPLAVAWVLYFMVDGWKPAERINHGELLAAPLVLDANALLDPHGVQAKNDLLRGHWTLLLLRDRECDAVCRESLDKAARVRLALREKSVRVRSVVLYGGQSAAGFPAAAQGGVVVARLGPGAFSRLRDRITSARGGRELDQAGLCVVDPLGNLIMVYEPGFEMKGMLADLKRLLKLSRIG